MAKLRLLVFCAWAVCILWLSLDPAPFRPLVKLLSWDKLQHALAYALLTLLGGWALGPFCSRPALAWRWAFFFALAYGALMEGAQFLLTRSRSAEPWDFVANAVGAGTVFLLALLLPALSRNGAEGEG